MNSAITHFSSTFRLLLFIYFGAYGSFPDAGNLCCLWLWVGAFEQVRMSIVILPLRVQLLTGPVKVKC